MIAARLLDRAEPTVARRFETLVTMLTEILDRLDRLERDLDTLDRRLRPFGDGTKLIYPRGSRRCQ